MLSLLFVGPTRDFDKRNLHFTVFCFVYRKKATVPNTEFEASANSVLKSRTSAVEKCDLLYKNLSVISKYHISINFLAQEYHIFYLQKIRNKNFLVISKHDIPC